MDLVDAVVHALCQAKIVVMFEHVLGHQDNHTAFEDLDLLFQLHVEANRLHGAFCHTHPGCRPYVPRLPHNTVQLHLSRQTITRQYRSAIRYQKIAPILETFVWKNFLWEQVILTT